MKYISLSGPHFNEFSTPLAASFPGMVLPGNKGHVLEGRFGRITLQEYTCNDFRISTYLLEVNEKVAIYPMARHPITALYIGMEGDFTIQLNNGPGMDMKAGTIGLFYLPAGEQQKSYFDKGLFEIMYANFSGPFLHSIAELHPQLLKMQQAVQGQEKRVWHLPFLPMNGEMLGIIRKTFNREVSPLTMTARITDLLAAFFSVLDQPGSTRIASTHIHHLNTMMEISDYIENNLTNDITVNMLARKAAMNHYTFAQVFKKIFAISPSEFVLQRRIHLAEQLLRNTALSIEEIAFKSGFSDRTHFYKAFSKIHGISPTKYRGDFGDTDFAT